ncbi:synaptogyrin-4 isoform X2 [Peromyscus leucopus]|uniref:synaptogyrin-4 isoform X2 n=1 Tax=Peromyscus leucopus TaxID=10041 RepID=UPI001884FD96|nr:synaptogyrin-4 isoform X2 [Peromyscus leucopus]
MHLPESLQDLADSETVRFLRRPKSISRICGGVFSLVIFSSLLTDGYQNRTENPQLRCVLNSNHVACSFAVEAGFLSFLSCLIFLALDARESRITGSRFKTAFQLLDFILADIPGLPGLPGPPRRGSSPLQALPGRGWCGAQHPLPIVHH